MVCGRSLNEGCKSNFIHGAKHIRYLLPLSITGQMVSSWSNGHFLLFYVPAHGIGQFWKFLPKQLDLLYLPGAGEKDEAGLVVAIRAQLRTISAVNDKGEPARIGDAVAFGSDNTHRHSGDGQLPEGVLVVVNQLLGDDDFFGNSFFVVVLEFRVDGGCCQYGEGQR